MKKPKYFVVKTDNDNPLQKVFKQWLNTTYNQGWDIDSSLYYYYGYDGNDGFNGTNANDRVSLFVNDPIILTLDEWYVLFIDNKCNFVIECKSKEEFDYVAVKHNHHNTTHFNFKTSLYFNNSRDYGSEKERFYPNHKIVSFNIYKKFIANDNQTTEMKNQTLTLEQLKELYKSDSCIEKLLTDLGIVLENKYPKSWEELERIRGFYIDRNSNIVEGEGLTKSANKNIIPTKELAEEILQFIQLSQCYYRYVGDWRPDWTEDKNKYVIRVFRDELAVVSYQNTRHFFAFPTTEMRDEFFKNFKEQLEKCKSLV